MTTNAEPDPTPDPNQVRGRPLRLALVPFERRPRGKNAGARKRRAKAGLGGAFSLPAGEVLISHVPPRGVLDRCSSGDLGRAGWLGLGSADPGPDPTPDPDPDPD